MVNRHESILQVNVESVMRGALTLGSLKTSGGRAWQVGDELIAHLARRGDAWVLLTDGTELRSDEAVAKQIQEIKRSPIWPAPVEGWSAVFVVENAEITQKNHLDGWVLYRNMSTAPLVFSYKEWPPEEHTRWILEVTREGQVVPPTPHPHLTKDEIVDYFSKHGHAFEMTLAPGEVFALPLQRLNSAEAGWGYKQRIGFQFWPLEEPSEYTITVEDRAFPDRPALEMPPVKVRVRAAKTP